jgi:hypothetical protein
VLSLATVPSRPAETAAPLSELLEQGPLTTAEATLVAEAVLSRLTDLHASGRAHGAVRAANVRVTREGAVLLGPARSGADSAAADLAATGRLLCDALGVGPLPAPGLTAAERSVPGLVALARSLAGGGHAGAEEAWAAVLEAAGAASSAPAKLRARLGLRLRTGRSEAVSDGAAQAEPPARLAAHPRPRVLQAPPAPPAPPAEPRRSRPALAFRPPALPRPALPPLTLPRPALPRPAIRLPALRRPHLPRLRPLQVQDRGLAGAAVATLLLVLLFVIAAQRLPDLASPARPALVAADRPQAAPRAASPDRSVRMFFDLAAGRRFDEAAQLWTPRLRGSVDPAKEIGGRFGPAAQLKLTRDDVLALDAGQGIATVAVAWTDVENGVTRHYSGEVYLATGPDGWRWDKYAIGAG